MVINSRQFATFENFRMSCDIDDIKEEPDVPK